MPLNIGLPKGSVLANSLNTIERIIQTTTSESILSYSGDNNVTCFLLKLRDIPLLIEKGMLHLGITSTEWIVERNVHVTILKKLDWCDARISLIGHDSISNFKKNRCSIECVTEYPNIANKYFSSNRNKNNVHITKVSGSTEALIPHFFNCGIELIETGKTIKMNGLIEIDHILRTNTVLITGNNIQMTNKVEKIINKI